VITAKDIQGFICKHWLLRHHCPYVCSNFNAAGSWEMDVIAITGNGLINEFEIKMSRADFFADFKKETKHLFYSKAKPEGRLDYLSTLIPNRFIYCCPKGLIQPQEVPDYAGLIHFTKFELKSSPGKKFVEFEVLKKAPIIHREKCPQKVIDRIAKTLSQRFVFGCALMTYQNRGSDYAEI
jgi:hypothetical protein